MIVNNLSFGSITIDGETWDKDIIITNGSVKKRKKAESKKYRDRFGHTPLSQDENIPWKCKRLIIGAGHSSSLPVMDEVKEKALRKGVACSADVRYAGARSCRARHHESYLLPVGLSGRASSRRHGRCRRRRCGPRARRSRRGLR